MFATVKNSKCVSFFWIRLIKTLLKWFNSSTTLYFSDDKISWASNGSRVISKDISWRLKKIVEISQRQRLHTTYLIQSWLRLGLEFNFNFQRGFICDEASILKLSHFIESLMTCSLDGFTNFVFMNLDFFHQICFLWYGSN